MAEKNIGEIHETCTVMTTIQEVSRGTVRAPIRGMRFPIVHQSGPNDCGPACLAMVAVSYGRPESISDLKRHARTDDRGTSLTGLLRAARDIGFSARGVRSTVRELSGIHLPAIAHWSEGGRRHFVVIYEVTDRRTTIGDPARGIRTLTSRQFSEYWTGILVLLEPSSNGTECHRRL